MTGLSDYVLEILWEGEDFALYRGRRDRDQSSLLAVAPVMEHPPAALLKRLNHEYALRNRLDPAWSARPLGLTHHDGRAMLVLEDCGGEPLTRLMDGGADGGRPDIGRFLRIAVGLAAALGRIHGQGLIHKDLRPDHVLIEPASGSVRLTGFGLASQLRREQPVPEPPEAISGTLAYMAPEQTGRMNRAVDARSDLYALGITLYEMLTGALPFTASDPMELVHCHIARLPAAPAERVPGLPGPVSDIVMKLLAKAAEDRYQTAAGLAADLRRCLEEWQEAGTVAAFPLGSRDVSGVLRIPEKLYGREPAAEMLRDAFRRVAARGTPELVLLSGPAGIGKSSVAGELHKAIVPLRGLFAQGKADPNKRDIPYATLAQVLGAATRQLLVKSERELAAWRTAIGTALAGNGQLVVDLVPDLERLIGPQPPVAELPPYQAERRVFAVLGAFLRVFADGDHPLALFLDDLQWLDAATLDFIADLAARPGSGHLLIVGACRDDGPDAARRMGRLRDAARAAGTPAQKVAIGPLAPADIGRMVADTVGCGPDMAWPLAQLIHQRTGGNPFFAIRLLKSLADDQLLTFDAERMAWTWDIDGIRARGTGEDIVALMVETLRQLPPATQHALTVLACLGSGTALQTLATVMNRHADAVRATLWEAAREGVVIEQGDAYRFDHDRVQEAAYLLVPDMRRTEIHLAAGRLLAGDEPVEALRGRVFDIVNQYNRALPLVSDPAERARLATLNLLAGRRAKASAAYQAARTFLGTGMALLGGDGWSLHHDLTFALALERGECEYLCGDVEAARGLIASLLRNAVTIDDRAAAYRLKMDLHVMRSEQVQAVDSALECLRLLGVDLPAHPTDAEVAQGYQAVWDRLGDRPVDSLIDLPLMTDPHLRAAMQVLSHLFSAAFATDANLIDLHVCRMVSLSLDHGVAGASSHGFAWFGLLIGPRLRRYADGHRFGRLAVALVERHDFAAWRAKAWFSRELVDLWTQPIDTAMEFVRAAFRMAVETGDLTIACYSCHHILVNRLLRGDPLEDVWRESESFVDFLHGRRFGDVDDNIAIRQRFIRAMQGRSDALASLGGDGFDEAAFEARLAAQNAPQVAGRYWIVKLQTRFLFGDHETAHAAAAQAGAVIWTIAGHIQLLDYHYYAALTLAARHDPASPGGGAATLAAMAPHLAQLAEWAEHGAATFRDRHLLAAAEAARVQGEDLEAMRLYEQAIQAAADGRFIQNQAIACELAGRFHLDRGLETAGHAHLRRARACYALWGADAKVRQLDRLYPRIAAASGRQPGQPGSIIRQFDATTVVQACHALSAEIVLPRLVETLMTSALRNAGADRGLLILPEGDGWHIEAEAGVHGDAIAVDLRRTPLNASSCPESLLRYAIRTEKAVILDDATRPNLFSEDPYINRRQPRSVAALPLLRQGRLAGLLYLENSLASEAFPHASVAILELLAAQAAISLDNARLYAALEEDLDARRQAEAALREARDQAEIANRAKSTFLANMSHELRTPLNAILGFAEIMKLGLLDQPHRYRAYAEDIHASGRHLLEIINDLLDVVQIEAGRLTLDERPLDISDVVAQALRLMTPQLDAAQLHLATEVSSTLPRVLADERAIRQILLNLLSNAAKFTGPGGRITVALGRADCGDVVLSVEDTGIGIAAADIDKLMQPFTQLHDAYERRRQGAGLGLFLVRSLAELHGGTAHIASRPGQGTIVTIRLPAARVLAG